MRRVAFKGRPPVRRRTRGRRRGLTLIEVLISLALLMMMIAAVGFFVGPWLTGAGFDAQARQFAAAMRFARAEAAITGRTVRLEFHETDAADDASDHDGPVYRVRVMLERQPLEEPHVFTPLRGRAWIDQLEDMHGFAVIGVRLTGPDADALRAVTDDAGGTGQADRPGEAGDGVRSVTFHPGGAGDAAEITLAPGRRGDDRRAVVRIDGLTGTVRHELTDAAALEAASDPGTDDNAAPDSDDNAAPDADADAAWPAEEDDAPAR